MAQRILVVEDHEVNRDLLIRRLSRKGYEVLAAKDGTSALQITREELPDLVLMDVNLPDIDGLDATRQLKADEKTAGIPVIALTAHAMSGDKEKALEAGCDDYDSKPIELPRLLEKMENLLSNKSA